MVFRPILSIMPKEPLSVCMTPIQALSISSMDAMSSAASLSVADNRLDNMVLNT